MRECKDKCFNVKDETYNLCISNTKLNFDVDMGYIGGNLSYLPLTDKPSINFVELIGNKTSDDLGLQEEINDITEQDIDFIIYGG